jgi:diguanylate cyclase (GGDEF)-like protein
MGSICWLLVTILLLGILLLPAGSPATIPLAIIDTLLFIYNLGARHLFFANRHGQLKTFIDLMVFLLFTLGVCWFTGKVQSNYFSLIYLGLMAASLTQGKQVNYLVGCLSVAVYLILAADKIHWAKELPSLHDLLELFPLILIGHLGGTLAAEAESARNEVERLSLSDDITSLHNMRNFFNLAHFQEKLSARQGKSFAICMIDADNLKEVNDQYGHLAGTALIRHVGRVIGQCIRESDIAARYGGDEFIILISDCTAKQAAQAVHRIISKVAESPFAFDKAELYSTISAGIASFPVDGNDVITVMSRADKALYSSKRDGKNRLTLYQTDNP